MAQGLSALDLVSCNLQKPCFMFEETESRNGIETVLLSTVGLELEADSPVHLPVGYSSDCREMLLSFFLLLWEASIRMNYVC